MLTTNVDVSDGLVNGARGCVVHIPINLTHILVKFDNAEVGVKAKQSKAASLEIILMLFLCPDMKLYF